MQKLIAEEASLQNTIALLRSIPGIGKFSSAVILAEWGDISLFHKPKQLSAYFGLEPSERQSGTFAGTKNKLSKRGSPYARAALNMAAHNAVCKHGRALPPNPVLADYYERKCNERPKKVALSAIIILSLQFSETRGLLNCGHQSSTPADWVCSVPHRLLFLLDTLSPHE